MNKRWLRIGLGLLVLAIWGAVIARAVYRPGPDEPSTPPIPGAPVQRPAAADDTTGGIPHLARDPFLDGGGPSPSRSPGTATAATPSRTKQIPPPQPNTPTKPWPKVVYKGTLRAKNDPGIAVAFVGLGGRDLLIRCGQEAEGIGVVALAPDSVVLRWNGEQRTFQRP